MKRLSKVILVFWLLPHLFGGLSLDVFGQKTSDDLELVSDIEDFLWSANVNKQVVASFVPTGRFVFIHEGFNERGYPKGKLTFLKAETGEVISDFLPCEGTGFDVYVYRRQWASFDSANSIVAISCQNDNIELWNVTSGKLLGKFRSWCDEPVISPDGKRLVTTDATGDEPPELFNTESQQRIGLLTAEPTFGWKATLAADFSADSKRLAVAYYTEVYLWDAVNGKLLFRLEDDETGRNERPRNQSPEFRIYDLAFTSDGRTLITGTARSIKFWDAASGKLRFKIAAGHKPVLNDLAINPVETLLATAAKDKSIKLWDMKTGNLVRTFTKPKETAQEITFSPDGKKLLYRAFDSQRAIIYDVESGKILWQSKHGTVETVLSPQWDMVLVKDFKLNVIKAYKTKFTFGK